MEMRGANERREKTHPSFIFHCLRNQRPSYVRQLVPVFLLPPPRVAFQNRKRPTLSSRRNSS